MSKNFEELFNTIEKRIRSKNKNSYSYKLSKMGSKKIAQKFGEESCELLVDYLSGSKKRTIEEAVDVIYHLLVLLKSKKITLKEIYSELEKRKK